MSRLYCGVCQGQEIIRVVYCDDVQKTLERAWGPCYSCERHDSAGRHASERVMGQDEADKLIQKGYRYLDTLQAQRAA